MNPLLHDDFWDVLGEFDAACLTTNGSVNKNGKAVMGRGIARQAADRDRNLPYILARHLRLAGNHVGSLTIMGRVPKMTMILSYPVKHHWHEQADLGLIERSMDELRMWASRLELKRVLLPVPGTANGKQDMDTVLQLLEPIIDDRIHLISDGRRD